MHYLIILSCFLIFFGCDKKGDEFFTNDEVNPLTLIPANYGLYARVEMEEFLKIPSISSRLNHETKRKPSLQLIPLEKIKNLYFASSSGAATESDGGLYFFYLKQAEKIDQYILALQEKFKTNKDVIFGKKEYNSRIIHTIRDKKQEIAACQLAPSIILQGPLNSIIEVLNGNEKNLSQNEKLGELLNVNPKDSLQICVLSAENLGSALQQMNFFNQVVVTAKATDKGAAVYLKSYCQDKAMAEKGKNAFLLLQTVLIFKVGKHLSAQDFVIESTENITSVTANLNAEALKILIEK